MGDSAMAVVAIIVATIIMGIFPLMAMANETDKTAMLAAQSATTDFVNKVRTTGKLTEQDYENYLSTLAATGNSFDVDLTLQILDENPAKKTNVSGTVTIGDNTYYVKYTTQLLQELADQSEIDLNEGDIFSVSGSNTNLTISQSLRNLVYKVTGNNSGTMDFEASGMCTTSAN